MKMKTEKRISQISETAQQVLFDDSSKIILMSDCHRGDGNWADDFSRNQNLYFAALTYYYRKDYTYIEIGDGDELWENKRLSDIKQAHSDVFWLLSGFYKEGRLYLIYGNHDMVKKDNRFVKGNLYQYYDEAEKTFFPLFRNIRIHEGMVLRYKPTGDKILLIHGHQADCMNHRLWKISRFLVRYLWRPLTMFGVNDPTRTAKNYKKKETIEKRLVKWVIREKSMLISGHTHRPMFPETDEPPYFNDGSCVHPRCITGLEIDNGCIILVKWNIRAKDDGTLFIGREVLAGPRNLRDYFDKIREM